MEKLNFLQHEFPILVATLKPDTMGNWGVMNAQQMIEHLSESIRIGNGRFPHKIHTPADVVEKYKAFMLSDKPFKENTNNPLISPNPAPVSKAGIAEAIEEYKDEMNEFVKSFKGRELETTTNPIFGELNYEEWLHLLHKHVVHHTKQFGLL